MANDFLLSTLTKYCEYDNPEKTGLLLLDLPTGSGKTHDTLRFIYDNYRKSSRKILFLTELKKNLPHDKIFKSFFEEDGIVDLYKKEVLFIDSNVDAIIARLEKAEKVIPDSIKQTATFKALKNLINLHHTLIHKPEKSSFDIIYVSNIKETIRLTTEPEFRELVRKYLNEHAPKMTTIGKIQLIKDNEKFKWIAQLYPTVLSAEKRVFFMSMDKFLTKNTTLVEQSYYFSDKTFLNNALIFIDEFDATKNVVLKHIINNQLNKRMDIVGLVEQIYSSLQSLTLPEIFKKDYKESKKAKMLEIFQKLDEKVNQLKKNFNIDYSIKTIGLTNQKNFLFHDYTYFTIASDNHKYIYLDVDTQSGINKIIFVPEKQEKPSVLTFLRAIQAFVKYFREATRNIAENYYQNKKLSNGKKDVLFSLESALKSFLETLKITGSAQKELMDSLLLREFSPQYRKKAEDEPLQVSPDQHDLSFYNTGFRYYDFEDSDVHDTKSKIFITDFDTTPERILLDLAKENFVIGISATARLKSVLCNYDLQYLENHLGKDKHFYELSDAEQRQFKYNFDIMTQDYVPIHAEFIKIEEWTGRLNALKLPKKVANNLRLKLDVCSDFVRKRYLKIATVFDKFVEKEDIKSFLCFLNAHPGSENQSLDIAILDIFFEAIIQKHQKESFFKEENNDFKVQNAYFVLNSTDFEEKKAKIHDKLRTGNKLFLITTYRTLGAGQNIQYKLDDFDEWLKTGRIKQIIGASNPAKEKDFDAIYLDKPTHILTNVLGEEKLSAADASKRIFELEMLNEAGHFSRKALLSEVTKTFKRTHKEHSSEDRYMDLYNTEDCRNAVAKEIMQAIGRMSRTQFKNNQIYIYADIDIVKEIKFFATSKHICLKEFQALVDKAKQESMGTPNQNGKPQNDINRNLSRCHEWIRRKVTTWDWNETSVAEWKTLREMTLRYPTISKQVLANNPDLKRWEFIYVPMWDSKWERRVTAKKYHFTQQLDYKTVNVNFSGEGKEVSEDAVQLPNLMKINELKSFFEQNNYATHFEKNEYIIAPEIFNNIYKGALGEVIGQFLFEKYIIAPNHLQELPLPIYERFDFKLEHGIFIDFKFWDEDKRHFQNSEMDDAEDFMDTQLQKIDNKIDIIKSKGFEFNKVFIINILASSELFKIAVRADERLVEVPYLIDKTDKNQFKIDPNVLIELQKYLTYSSNEL